MRSLNAYKKLAQRWAELPPDHGEPEVEANLVQPLLDALGLKVPQIRTGKGLGGGFGTPDRLVYQDINQPPVLVIENKKRTPDLAAVPEKDFAAACKDNPFYRQAVGYADSGRANRGIKQYLDSNIPSSLLASYGLVFNGDFFQLWRRVDGLILPMTPIQKVTRANIPGLMQQLEYCLENPRTALICAIWNQKGGVAKTTNIINVGATLAICGKKVLLIDLDPQNDLTRGIGADPSESPPYLELCAQKVQLKEWDAAKDILTKAIQHRTFPTSDRNSYTLSVLTTQKEAVAEYRDHRDENVRPQYTLKQIITLLRNDYDYIFIDISPVPDQLTKAVLMTCDTVLIPADLGGKSLHHAMHLYSSTIPRVREIRMNQKERLHCAPWNLGIVFSNCPSDVGKNLKDCIEQEMSSKGFTGRQCKTQLKTFAQTKVAEFKHTPVVSWRSSPITKLYGDLTNEIFLNHNFVDH